MALTIEDVEAERLATEVAELAGETPAQAIIEALRQRRIGLLRERPRRVRLADVRDFLEREVWSLPTLPAMPDDDLLGYGPGGA